jgi:hypothetical protein
MTLGVRTFLAGAAVLAVVASAAQAQRSHVHEVSFDVWCQEYANLPHKRCDKRLPEDDAAYQDYLNRTETYETQRLNNEAQDRQIQRSVLRNDPSANPAGTPPTQPIVPH